MLIQFLQAVLSQSLGGEPEIVDPEDRRAMAMLAHRLGPEEIVDLLDRCIDAEEQVDRFMQLALVLEALIDALTGRIAVAS
jgi:hypothetical protein